MAFSKAAHHAGNHYFANGDFLYQILSRRIIDRQWFPSVYRPGFDTIRPESNAFLEQFIPFEYSSQSYVGDTDQRSEQVEGLEIPAYVAAFDGALHQRIDRFITLIMTTINDLATAVAGSTACSIWVPATV